MSGPSLKGLYELGMEAHAGLARPFGGRALPPVQLFLEVTDRCNLDCRMCFYRGTLAEVEGPEEPGPDLLSLPEILQVVRDLPSARLVSISGGEPFARADLPEILTALSRLRWVTVETNGTLLGDDGARHLARLGSQGLPRPGLVAVDFSILGPRPVHDRIARRVGSFDRALASMRTLLATRRELGREFPKVTLKAAILRENVHHLEELADVARAEGVDYFVLKEEDPGKVTLRPGADGTMGRGTGTKAPHPRDLDGLAARLEKILEAGGPGRDGGPECFVIPLKAGPRQLEHHLRHGVDVEGATCKHPWSRVGVLPGGEVYSCKLFATGSVREQGVRERWNGPAYRTFRRTLRDRGPVPDCAGCCFLEPAPLDEDGAATTPLRTAPEPEIPLPAVRAVGATA